MPGSFHQRCGCSHTMSDGRLTAVHVCSRHGQDERVQAALRAQHTALLALAEAVRQAHADVSPLQVEQEERDSDDWRVT